MFIGQHMTLLNAPVRIEHLAVEFTALAKLKQELSFDAIDLKYSILWRLLKNHARECSLECDDCSCP